MSNYKDFRSLLAELQLKAMNHPSTPDVQIIVLPLHIIEDIAIDHRLTVLEPEEGEPFYRATLIISERVKIEMRTAEYEIKQYFKLAKSA